MELNQLKTFVTVADEGHLTRAAERLFTSQPALSAQLKALEDQLGLALFDRTPKGMRLTAAGEHLLVQAKQTLQAAEDMLNQAKRLQQNVLAQLDIGINSDYPFLRIPELLKQCRDSHPGLNFSFIHSTSAHIVPDIRKGKLDSGFFFGPCSLVDLHVVKLAETKTAVVIPSEWAEQARSASIDVLAQMPWIYTTSQCPFYALKEALFKHSEFTPHKDLFVDTEDGIRALIKSASGISLLRDDDADKAEQEGWGVRWEGETPTLPLQVAVHAKRTQEPAIQAWLAEVSACWAVHQRQQKHSA